MVGIEGMNLDSASSSGSPMTGLPSTTIMLHSSPNKEGTAPLFNLNVDLAPTDTVENTGTLNGDVFESV